MTLPQPTAPVTQQTFQNAAAVQPQQQTLISPQQQLIQTHQVAANQPNDVVYQQQQQQQVSFKLLVNFCSH